MNRLHKLYALPLELLLAVLVLVLGAGPTLAQSVYPTGATGVKVSGTVPLQCNAGMTACTPPTSSNPQPVLAQASAPTVTDVSSAAITSTATDAATSTANQNGETVCQYVTAVSGTTPTLDTVVQESIDGTNWTDIYHFARLTATGFECSPVLPVTGQYLRYVRTVTGTTPSFTMSVQRRATGAIPARTVRRFFDRTLDPNTLNAVSASFNVEGAQSAYTIAVVAAGGTGPAVTVQYSFDRVNWISGTPITATAGANTLIASFNVAPFKWLRFTTSTAGAGATLTYVAIQTF